MAQFVCMASSVEINGQMVLSVVNRMGAFKTRALEILKKHGIENPMPDTRYPQEAWLDAFKEIQDTIGSHTLIQIGLKGPERARPYCTEGSLLHSK